MSDIQTVIRVDECFLLGGVRGHWLYEGIKKTYYNGWEVGMTILAADLHNEPCVKNLSLLIGFGLLFAVLYLQRDAAPKYKGKGVIFPIVLFTVALSLALCVGSYMCLKDEEFSVYFGIHPAFQVGNLLLYRKTSWTWGGLCRFYDDIYLWRSEAKITRASAFEMPPPPNGGYDHFLYGWSACKNAMLVTTMVLRASTKTEGPCALPNHAFLFSIFSITIQRNLTTLLGVEQPKTTQRRWSIVVHAGAEIGLALVGWMVGFNKGLEILLLYGLVFTGDFVNVVYFIISRHPAQWFSALDDLRMTITLPIL